MEDLCELRLRLLCSAKHKSLCASCPYLEFEGPNGRSKLFEYDLIIEISLKINFFFLHFYYILDGYEITSFGWCRNH
jgi:hypothetical protein